MNILHIAKQSSQFCPYDVLENCTEQYPLELFRKAHDKFEEANLIIIKLDDHPFDGIQLLKLIRLHHIRTHCIAYSKYQMIEYVKADPNKSILLSEGVSFVPLPNFIDDTHLNFNQLVSTKSPENLEEYFLFDYKQFFSDNRHFHANWWAPLRIMEYLKRADNINDEDMVFTDEEAKKNKSSYYGLVLRYIKTMRENAVWDNKMKEHIAESPTEQHIEQLRNELGKNELPRILYFDDMAGYGWDFVLQRLVYRENSSTCFTSWSLTPEDLIDYEVCAKKVIRKVQEKNANLIIMDLRLKNEKGDMKPKDLSGIKLLEALRKELVPCPILVITASKNPEAIEQIYASGADACWRKEGFDENNSPDAAERVAFTWNKIEQLLTFINILLGSEFSYLYTKMLFRYKQFALNDQIHWWEKVSEVPCGGHVKSITKSQFLDKVMQAIVAFRNNLVDKIKERTEQGNVDELYVTPTNILFELLDMIHPTVKGEVQSGTFAKIERDWNIHGKNKPTFLEKAYQACRKRNVFIHHEDPEEPLIEIFESLFNNLMEYLSPVLEEFEKKEVVDTKKEPESNKTIEVPAHKIEKKEVVDTKKEKESNKTIEVPAHKPIYHIEQQPKQIEKISGRIRIYMETADWGDYFLDWFEKTSILTPHGVKFFHDTFETKFAIKASPVFFMNFIRKRPGPNDKYNCKAKITDVLESEKGVVKCRLEPLETLIPLNEILGPYEQDLSKGYTFAPCFNFDKTVTIITYYRGSEAWTGEIIDNKLVNCQWPKDTEFEISKFAKTEITKADVGTIISFILGGELKLSASGIELVEKTTGKFGGTGRSKH